MGHVGEQKLRENGDFGNENGDVKEDLAFQGCRNLKIVQKISNFAEIEIFPYSMV